MKSAFKITGGKPLHGSVRIGGAKNASYKVMIAALLGEGESRILNFSHISDVTLVGQIIGYLGGSVDNSCERAYFINPDAMDSYTIKPEHGAQGRFSTMFIPALLHRFGKAVVPAPGGDKIGKRPLDRHFNGLRKLGATITVEDGNFVASCDQLVGADYTFEKNTHTGTETLIMAAVKAKGTTILKNAAQEPEVDDLIKFLNTMGANIKRTEPRTIVIEGVEKLHGAIHKLLPDRNEAVSYACTAIGTKGDVIIENARAEHLRSFLEALDQIGAGYEVGDYGIRFYYKGPLQPIKIKTAIEPGFMTDWQPLFATLLTQCEGTSTLHEAVMLKRFQYVDFLTKMGANITFTDIEVENPTSFYNFNWEEHQPGMKHAIEITGPSQLSAGSFEVFDLRHGASLIMAALMATGTTTVTQIEHVDRGYEKLDERLRSLGAQIERVQAPASKA